MGQIQDLRNKEENSFNFIELIERLTKAEGIEDIKYIKMIDRLIKGRLKERVDKLANDSFGDNLVENAFIAMLFSNIILPQEMYLLNYFCAKHKLGGINGIDFQTVDIDTVLGESLKLRKKELEAQKQEMFETIHENDEWLIIQPLSYEASTKYGAHTKWCTAAKNEKSHYESYTKEGILIYCINKKDNNIKYGVYYNMEHKSEAYNPSSALSIWDIEDKFTEIFDVKMPIENLKIIGDYVKNNKLTNQKMMKKKYAELFESNSKPGALSGKDAPIIEATSAGRSLDAVRLIREIGGLDIRKAKDLYDTYYEPRFHPGR